MKKLIAVCAVMLMLLAGCAKADVNHMIWTHSEWLAAEEKERIECAEEYIEALYGEESGKNPKAYIDLIEAGLAKNPGITVSGLVDMARIVQER